MKSMINSNANAGLMGTKEMGNRFYPHDAFGDIAQQSIMPIFAIADGNIIPLGTGFSIMTNGLLMTAKHVVEEFLMPNPKRRDGSGYYKDCSLYALHLTSSTHGPDNELHNGGPWQIVKAHFAPELDIAFCWLRAMYKDGKPYMIPTVRLSLELPPVGSRILGFGYHKSTAKVSSEIVDGRTVVEYSHEVSLSEGFVAEILAPQGFRRFPHFMSDARFEPGMSGGPIFKENGTVCGVICSSLGGCDEDTGYISYVSLIWPAFAIAVETKFAEGGDLELVSIFELAKRKFISCDHSLDRVEIVETNVGRQIVYK